jgi:peptidoglycan/xylan/chitin deacetylase (PgdA/CDA1 family)
MYHYVRDPDETRFPGLKILPIQDFRGQLEYILKYYRVCSASEVAEAAQVKRSLPQNSCLLTFDDGFADHYHNVFPLLLKHGIPGCFYVAAKPMLEHAVLDVHKLHFVLAVCPEKRTLLDEVLEIGRQLFPTLDNLQLETLVNPRELYSRFDRPDVMRVKRLLQKGLPENIRSGIVDELFRRYVSQDEAAFAMDLYMSVGQLQEMRSQGMHIGGHGHRHRWMATISGDEQRAELEQTRAFLQANRAINQWWSMAYPYGSYNTQTLDIVPELGCRFALTTEVGINSDLGNPYELRRLDANDLPCSADAPVSKWTELVA